MNKEKGLRKDEHQFYSDVPTLDLFSIRSREEIKKRLGDDWFISDRMPQYYNAIFMSLWNKISKNADSKTKMLNNIGDKIKKMIEVWVRHYNPHIAKVSLKITIA